MEPGLNLELSQCLGSIDHMVPLSFRRLKTVLEKVVPALALI